LADQATALRHPDFLASVTDDYLRQAIAEGRANTTMSAWSVDRGGPLSRADTDALITFIRGWGSGARKALDERPNTGSAPSGAPNFARSCASCHGPRGTGGPNVGIGNPELLKHATNGFLRLAITKGRSGTPMPGFSATLGDPAVEDIVALLRSWQTGSSSKPPPPVKRPDPIPLGPVPLNPHGPEPIGFQLYPSATKADVVKAQLDRRARIALLDARAPPDYMNEHIAGAVSVPFYDPDPYIASLPKDTWLVSYCSCPHAESVTLARKLVAKGFSKVTVLDEGLGVWKRRKYETRTGAKP
jgi:mono/diheme cytochrome c family protein/rhodanese-related sulfurtransferase